MGLAAVTQTDKKALDVQKRGRPSKGIGLEPHTMQKVFELLPSLQSE